MQKEKRKTDTHTTAAFLILASHHLRLPRRPLARRTTFIPLVHFLFHLIAKIGIGVFFLWRHDVLFGFCFCFCFCFDSITCEQGWRIGVER